MPDPAALAILVPNALFRGAKRTEHKLGTPEFREARELTRCRRQLVQARTTIRNEVSRLLAHRGIALRSAEGLSNAFGASGMAILEALAEGRSLEQDLPRLLHRSVKHKAGTLAAALEAGLGEVSRQLLGMHLGRLEAVEEDIAKVERMIAAHLAPYQDRLDLLMTIPGVSYLSACVILAELGVDMAQWPTEKHLAAWGGVAPGCRESAGKQRRAATRKGNPYLVGADKPLQPVQAAIGEG